MEKTIDNIAQAREIIRKLLVVLYEVKPYETDNSSHINYNGEDVDKLLSRYQDAFEKYYKHNSKENERKQYILRLSFLIQEYKYLEGETEASLRDKGESPFMIASALDSMRMFTDYLVETIKKEIEVRSLSFGLKEILPFRYKMNQPEDSCVEIFPQKVLKSKSTDHINLGHYPFDLGKLKNSKVDKDEYQKVFKEINYFKPGEKVLIVRTRGDNFALYKNRTGYSGDWQEHHILRKGNTTIEVDKIMIIHFFAGQDNRNAHVYLADYDYYKLRPHFKERRYRYWFKNIASFGYIEGDFSDDFESAVVEVVEN